MARARGASTSVASRLGGGGLEPACASRTLPEETSTGAKNSHLRVFQRPASASPLARRAWLAASLASAAIFAASFAKTGFGVFGDGVGYYAPLRSLLFDHDLAVADEVARFAPQRWPHPVPAHSKFPIGLSLVLAPFFVAGHVLASVLALAGVAVTTDGYSWPYELAYCAGSFALGWLGLVAAWRGARLVAGERAALLAVLGVWFASPLFFYLLIETSMAHAVSQALVSATLYVALTRDWRHDPRASAAVGALLGLATLVRPQDGLFALTLGCWALFPPLASPRGDGAPSRRGVPRGPGIAALVAAGVVSVQVLVYVASFGSLSAVPYLHEAAAAGRGLTFDWLHPRLGAVLVSPLHGLFSWHPLTAVAVLGWAALARSDARLAAGLALGWLAQLWVIGAWHDWWQGASLGGRMFASSSFPFVLGLAALWQTLAGRAGRLAGAAVTAAAAAWNVSLAVQYRLGMLPAEAPVSWLTMARGHVELVHRIVARVAGG